MNNLTNRPRHNRAPGFYSLTMAAVSLGAIVASFALARSTDENVPKSKGLSAIIVGYLVIAILAHYMGSRKIAGEKAINDGANGDDYTDERLFAIQEASEYFGGTLKSGDMFRLVANKVNEILPFSACVLLLVDRPTGRMRVAQAQGDNADKLIGLEIAGDAGLAGRCGLSGMAQVDRGMIVDKETLPAEALNGFRSSAAVPLIRSGEVFAVVQLFSESRTAFDGRSISILEAVAERVTPMILSSLSFEQSVSTALTDPITDLPNERAFHLVLENQIAETQRKREERPLTILAIDIKGFDEMNSRFGHAAGDRVLSLIARVIKGQLRQMDFFARASNDEFLAILPTADETVSAEVIERIIAAIRSSQFFVNEMQSLRPELNFGIASFGKHGETADPLILAARLQKQQAKAKTPAKVVWFPQQFAD